jgi:MFS transporter, SHS family, lactate transporter
VSTHELAGVRAPAIPWYQQVTREQWRAFWAVFLGWVVDAFDFNILTFVLIDIQRSFTVDRTLAGALGTVTLIMRLTGGSAAGTMADKWGRKLPLILSVLWFSLFAFLSGFSTSYAMLFGLRALFGIGMGGEWAAGMPLVLEHWPSRFRGLASGLLLGGWYWGNLLAAAAFSFLYPLLSGNPNLAWRAMFWIAIVPALLTLWIRRSVQESPVWLDEQRRLRQGGSSVRPPKISLVRIFQHDLLGTTIQTTIVIGAFMCVFYSIQYWYATFLREAGRSTIVYPAAFNIGAIVGTAVWGRISEGSLGRRGAVTITALTGVVMLPFYLRGSDPLLLWIGALGMGVFGCGIWGMAPAYVTERFPTAVRGVGPGFCYHAAAAIGSAMPIIIGRMQNGGMALTQAMSLCIVTSLLVSAGIIWLGPETRGRSFES